MPQALPLTSMISQGSTRKRTSRTLSAQFGDGYDQSAPDGINHLVDTWSIRYENLTVSERNTLMAALDAVGGFDYLTWTPPNDTAKKFKVVDGVSETPQSGDIYSIAFNLRQTF